MRKTIFLGFLFFTIALITGCDKVSETDIRDVFVATYSVSETWTENGKTMTKPVFSMFIEKSSQRQDLVLLNNFANYGAGITAEATINGNNLTISQQTLPNSKVITGTGALSGSTLALTYTESLNSISINISATATKK
jgi:hypothetical protein